MGDEEKFQGAYGYKCKCGRLIEIDSRDENCSFFFAGAIGSRISLLSIECHDCPIPGTACVLRREDIGGTLLPLTKGKVKFFWQQ